MKIVIGLIIGLIYLLFWCLARVSDKSDRDLGIK